MTKMTLTYFDAPASRGEECRLALFVAGVPFTDERLSRLEWEKRRGTAPYGALPMLTEEGHRPIAQSNAILRLVGSMHGLHPADPWEAARQEGLMGAIEDMRVSLGATRLAKDDERKVAREEFAKGYLQTWGKQVQAQLGDPFVGGSEIQVADLKLFVAMGALLKGSIDHIPTDVFKDFPKLTKHHAAVKAHPKVVEWYAR
jgi:prostaglandin-H2 D-isomerase / glutathione transferase